MKAVLNRIENQPATIETVAILAGVSTATVSRAINEPHKVRVRTAQRVFNAMNELSWQPNPDASALAKRNNNRRQRKTGYGY